MAAANTRISGALHVPLNTLALRRGGLIRAVMLRANAVAAQLDTDVVIEVLACQPRLGADVADLVQEGFLDPRVHVRSVLAALDPALPEPPGDDPVCGCVHHTGASGAAADAGPAVDPAADPRALALTAAPVPGRRTKEDRGSGDALVRVQYLRDADRAPVHHRWFGRDGRCYLGIWVDPATGRWQSSALAADEEVTTFPGMTALYRHAFERLLADEIRPVLSSEFREVLPNLPDGFDTVVLGVRHPSLRRVAVLHSNHALLGQNTLPKRSSPGFTTFLTGINGWDRMVVATTQQRDDIAAQYGGEDRLAVIPHYGPEGLDPEAGEYDPDRFVLVARIHKKKRVDEAIEAFRLVVDENPRARLEIWGFGYGDALEKQIEAQVARLGLADNVTFPGFASDVSAIYRGACASIQTSQSEGFGMALLESLAHGVPVVAYDVDYGAREVIRDGVDGFVVPWGRRDELARRIVELSRDRETRMRMAAAGPEGAARFSRSRYAADWGALLSQLPVTTDVRVVGGALEVSGAADQLVGTLLVRSKASGEENEVALLDGTARAPLPAAEPGTIVDVYVRSDEDLRRLPGRPGAVSDDPQWRPYVTEWGNLSIRRLAKPSAPRAPVAAATGAMPHRMRRLARGVVRRWRARRTGRGAV